MTERAVKRGHKAVMRGALAASRRPASVAAAEAAKRSEAHR